MPDDRARYWDFRRRKDFMSLRSEEKAASPRDDEYAAIMGAAPCHVRQRELVLSISWGAVEARWCDFFEAA